MQEDQKLNRSTEKALLILKERGGVIRTAEALKAGIHPRTFYSLRDTGILEEVSRGVYRLSELPAISNPDIVAVASRLPRAVICLISALAFHDLTTQVPHEVSIALEKGAETPRMDFPPLSVHRFSKASFEAGIEHYDVDDVTIRVYSPEKTLADCFKFRNKLGMEVVLEALKRYKSSKEKFKIAYLLKYARICRVQKIMQPYLETIA
jgi:predicted transcriptional regulator of viral defense system